MKTDPSGPEPLVDEILSRIERLDWVQQERVE
jgi:hypothetical protein